MAGPLVRWDSWVKDFLGCPDEKKQDKNWFVSRDCAEHICNNKIGSPWSEEAIRFYLPGNWIIELRERDVDYFLNYQESRLRTPSSSRTKQQECHSLP